MAAPPTFDPQESKGIYRLSIGSRCRARWGDRGDRPSARLSLASSVYPRRFLHARIPPGPIHRDPGHSRRGAVCRLLLSLPPRLRPPSQVGSSTSPASVLCLIGSLGFLLLLVTAALLLGSTSSLVACLHGAPSHALSCASEVSNRSASDTSLIGFWLAWIGGVGILLGLSLAGRRFASGMLSGGAVLYGLLLIVLVGPFVVLFVTLPGASYLTLVAPALAILATALAFGGASRAFHIRST